MLIPKRISPKIIVLLFDLVRDPENDACEEEGDLHDDRDGKKDGEGDDVLLSFRCALVEEREDKT